MLYYLNNGAKRTITTDVKQDLSYSTLAIALTWRSITGWTPTTYQL